MKKIIRLITIISIWFLCAVNCVEGQTFEAEESTVAVKYDVIVDTTTQAVVEESTPTIRYIFKIELDYAAGIAIDVYDKTDTPVMSTESYRAKAGMFSIDWDGESSSGKLLEDGTYFYKMYSKRHADNEIRMISGDFEVKEDTTTTEPAGIEVSFKDDFKVIDSSAVKINRVTIVNNTRTEVSYLLGKFNIKEMLFYTEAQIEESMNSLQGSPFAEIEEYSIVPYKALMGTTLRVKIKEKSLNSLAVTVGYNPPPDTGGDYTMPKALSFSSKNMRSGVHRDINLLAEAPDNNRVVYDVDYSESVGAMFFNLDYYDERQVISSGTYMGQGVPASIANYDRTKIGVTLTRPIIGSLRITLGYNRENIDFDDEFGRAKNNIVCGLSLDKGADNGKSLLNVLFDELSLEVGLDSSDSARNLSKLRMFGNYEFDLGGGILLELKQGEGIIIANTTLPYYELFRLGGMKNMKGYNEDNLACLSYVWGSIDLKIPFRTDSFFYLYGNTGKWSDTRGDFLKYGATAYGLGYEINWRNWSFDINLTANNFSGIPSNNASATTVTSDPKLLMSLKVDF